MANRVFPYLKTTAPTVNDDTGDGFKVGDIWLDTTNDVIYQAIDVTAAAAVWIKVLGRITTTDRIIGRDTAGGGDWEELTLSAVLDFIGSAAQGDVLYRGASTWARLAAGTNGQFLQTQGASANPQWATASGHPMNGRLTLETGVPISISAQTAKTTLYLTPFQGNQIAVYTGSAWTIITLTGDLSITLAGLTASLPYDVFVYSNAGVLTLELTAWTNATTRATALTTQDLILVKTGATTRRYIGTICITSTTGQCEDSVARRLVYNYYNQVPRQLTRIYIASHNYTTAAWRYWNNSQANSQVEIVLGVAQNCMGVYRVNITSLAGGGVSFGIDSTSPSGGGKGEQFNNAGDAASSDEWSFGIGYHYWTGIEYGNAGGMTAERISMTMTAMM